MDDMETKTLQLPCGPVIVQHTDGLLYARGIKYAHAGRFEKPIPVKWETSRDCTQPATICPQLPSRLAIVNGDIDGGRNQSEDCLHVTVAAPDDAKTLPVMVFFHGGGYVSGGGDLDAYSPCDLAKKGVVAVSVTNRLGHFGYLPIPGMAPANLGLFDQIEALRWVQSNISSFGGDPKQVTIFGQSAGGDSVFCLLICEETKELFHRGIIQSAPMGRFAELEDLRRKMISAMGEQALGILKSSDEPLSTEGYLNLQPQLLATAANIHPSLLTFGTVFGEAPLPPQSQIKTILRDAAEHKPIFIGYTENEGSAFAHLSPDHSEDWFTQEVFVKGSDRVYDDICEIRPGSPSYKFIWKPEGSKWGAAHCIELPFLLGGCKGWPAAPMLDGCNAEKIIETLGDQIKNLWVAFARGHSLDGQHFIIDENFTYAE